MSRLNLTTSPAVGSQPLSLSIVCALISLALILALHQLPSREAAVKSGKKAEGTDHPGEAMKWRLLAWRDEQGAVPADAIARAVEAREENIAYWRERPAPSGLDPAAWVSRGPQNIGGRTRTLLIHPQQPNILFAGAASGGVWKSIDGGAHWAPVNDFLLNLAAVTLVFDPANPNTIYCGTGEGVFNADAIRGAGIFKSTDGGTSWSQLPSTAGWAQSGRVSVNRLAIAPNNSQLILAATRYGGLHRSLDGGATWTTTRDGQGSYQVAFHPTDGNKAIAHLIDYDFAADTWFHSALYSNDGGASWQTANFNGIGTRLLEFDSRIELAYAPSDPTIVYALSDDHLGSGGRIWRSTDGGQNFTVMTGARFGGAQYWYNSTLWVSPVDSSFLVAGGVHLFKSTNGGANVAQISNGYINTQNPHPDQHFIVHDPGFNGTTNRRVFIGNDGGVFRTDDISTASPISAGGWVALNDTYQTSQFYGAAGHGATGLIIGGTQDNGTLRLVPGNAAAILSFGGDGGFSAIDHVDDRYCYGEYVRLLIHRSTNGGLSSSYIYQGITDAGNSANFIAPFILDPNEPNRLLAGGASLWRTNDARTGSPPTWAAIRPPGTSLISAIAVAPGNSDIIWVGQNDGRIYRTVNGTSPAPIWVPVDDNSALNPLPNRFPTRILIDPVDANRVYVAFGGFADGNLQRTINGGVTWSDATGSGATGLPLAPVRGIARHPQNASWIYAGTEVGVFTSDDGGANWSTTNQGPANVSVDELVFMHGSTTLLAATHGRGIWTIETGPGGACDYAIAPASANFAAPGGNGSFNVSTDADCDWTATSADGWIAIIGGPSGRGHGQVNYSVAPNTGNSVRSGMIRVAGLSFTVRQGIIFADVDPNDTFAPFISKLAASGVTTGCGVDQNANQLYCPNQPVTREQMAAFLVRALGQFNPPVPPSQRFSDVPLSNFFYAFIEELAARRITTGCGGGNYCPSQEVTREQMAAFLLRSLGVFTPPAPAAQRFGDVPPNNFFYAFIEELAVRGITLGCGGGNYCPGASVTRGQMAAFLVRAFGL